jgi:hypothetical protein
METFYLSNTIVFLSIVALFLIVFLYKPWKKHIENLEDHMAYDGIEGLLEINSTGNKYILTAQEIDNETIVVKSLTGNTLVLDFPQNLYYYNAATSILYNFTIWNKTNKTIHFMKTTSSTDDTPIDFGTPQTISSGSSASYSLQTLFTAPNDTSQFKLTKLFGTNIY